MNLNTLKSLYQIFLHFNKEWQYTLNCTYSIQMLGIGLHN